VRKPSVVLALLVVAAALAGAAPASAGGGPGQFVIRCPYSHTLMDDPIVDPGRPGASHSHDFFGNRTTDAYSTMASMLAGRTTCRATSDTAGYWSPTVSIRGTAIRPTFMKIYYLGDPDLRVETIPPGLQMVGGSKTATTAGDNPHVHWYCGEKGPIKTPRELQPYDCAPYASYPFVDGVVAVVDMPSCWDGAGLSPEHVEYPVGGNCPAGWHQLPRLSERVHLGVMDPLDADGQVALSLSSGPYWTMHADFWNTWQQSRLDDLVSRCLDVHVHCGSIASSVALAWSTEFGTSRYDLAYAAAPFGDGVAVTGFTNDRLPGETSHHRSDVFVRAIRPDGGAVWTTQFGGSGIDQGLALASAPDGLYVAGSTDGRFPKQDAAGGTDAFVAKLGAGGRVVWTSQFGSRGDDRATAIVVGRTGLIVAGDTTGRLGTQRHGARDGFVARVAFDGTVGRVRQFGGPADETVGGLTLSGGRTYVAGTTTGTFGGMSAGGTDGFVRAMRRNGAEVWTRMYGTTGDDAISSIAATTDGLFVAGSTGATWPGESSRGGLDAFVSRLGTGGAFVWTRQLGSLGDDAAAAVAVEGNDLYVAGSANGPLLGETALGETDAFAARFLKNGAPVWSTQFGTNDFDQVYGAAVNGTSFYVAGTTHGVFDGQTNAGDRDVFVTRLAFT
jgi:Domain of unknown function (DUF1996)